MASPSSKAFALAKHFLQKPPQTPGDDSTAKSIAWQIEHRLQLVSSWDIQPGSRVLELGCGQGDCTIALADAVGEEGHVDAVDPGSPDYGSPYTLAQAQSHITHSTPLGPRITFHLATDPLSFLSSLSPSHPPYDYTILSYSIWYFASPSTLTALAHALRPHTRHLCIAEWSLYSRLPSAQPHILTALLLASIQAKRKSPTDGNIRTVLSPQQIIARVTQTGAGFKLEREETTETNEGMLDGCWEAIFVVRTREKVMRRLEEEEGVGEREMAVIEAGFDAVESSVARLQGGVDGVRCMDSWVGRFVAV